LAVLFWLIILVGQTIAAVLWWWLQPGGFEWSHPRFWLNRVLPVLVLAWCVGSLAALHREDRKRLVPLLTAWPSAWGAAALAGRLSFPVTLARLWLAPLCLAMVMTLGLIPVSRLLCLSRDLYC
jgi:hypothetical protein